MLLGTRQGPTQATKYDSSQMQMRKMPCRLFGSSPSLSETHMSVARAWLPGLCLLFNTSHEVHTSPLSGYTG